MSPMVEAKALTLSEFAGGAAEELFQNALKQVLENIDDPNVPYKPKRTITLDFDFVCNEERKIGDVELKCSLKIPGVKPVQATLYFGKDHGVLVALEQPRQEDLFTNPAGAPRPLSVSEGGKA